MKKLGGGGQLDIRSPHPEIGGTCPPSSPLGWTPLHLITGVTVRPLTSFKS